MSAFVVSHEHITVLLYLGLRPNPYHDGPMSWSWRVPDMGELSQALTVDTADRTGQMLLDINYAAVDYGYRNTTPTAPGVYVYRRPIHTNWTDGEALKAVHCFAYQTWDLPDWRDTEACAFYEALQSHIMQGMPGYHEADTWGITQDTVPMTRRLRAVR